MLTVEVLEANAPCAALPVAAFIDEILRFRVFRDRDGQPAHAGRRSRFAGDPPCRSNASPYKFGSVWRAARVVATSVKSTWLKIFDEKIAGMVVIAAVVLALFGLVIAVGVVYNSARIAFQERALELQASHPRIQPSGGARGILRAVRASSVRRFAARPRPGAGDRGGLDAGARQRDLHGSGGDQFRHLRDCRLDYSGAGIASALLVRRRIDRLDLVSVLKTRD